jgi:hypothetical protein
MTVANGNLLTDEQIPLANTYRAVHVSNGKRVRDLYVRALVANGVSQGMIARETEREPSAITRMLSGEQGMAADVEAAILAHDLLGIVPQGIAAMVGWKAERVLPDPAERIRKLEAALSAAIAALQEATR